MISIFLAAYNGQDYLAEQLDSLFRQTMPDFALYVSDDGSRDDTAAIVQIYAAKYPGRITLCPPGHGPAGAKHNFMRMMTQYRDDYCMLCDQDDVWLPDKIEKTLALMHKMEDQYGPETPLLVHTDLAVVDADLRPAAPSFHRLSQLRCENDGLNRLLVQNIVTGCTAMYNRALAELLSEAPPGLIMHDWWLALLAAAFGKIAYLDEPLALYRQHGRNEVGAQDTRSFRYRLHRLMNAREMRASIQVTYAQAESLLSLYGSLLSDKNRRLLSEYIQLPALPKCARMRRVFRLGVFKSGFLRNLAYLAIV